MSPFSSVSLVESISREMAKLGCLLATRPVREIICHQSGNNQSDFEEIFAYFLTIS